MTRKTHKGIRQVRGKFEARVMIGAKRRSLGCFDTEDAALAAYIKAKENALLQYPSLNPKPLTRDRLKSLFSYDHETGAFSRLSSVGGSTTGTVAGGVNKTHKYRFLRVDGVRYPEHRLAWLYMTGSMPPDQIDHKDGNRANNRFSNLRLATYFQNSQNRPVKSSNSSGYRGVTWHKNNQMYHARIMVNGRSHSLGYFHSPEEAHDAYLDAKRRLHRFQPVPRDFLNRIAWGS